MEPRIGPRTVPGPPNNVTRIAWTEIAGVNTMAGSMNVTQ